MNRNLWNTGTVSAENLPKREVRMRIQIVDNVTSILHHHSVSFKVYYLFIVTICLFLVGA
mgnify:CR=1 FL=1